MRRPSLLLSILLFAPLWVASLSSCGPIRSTVGVISAEKMLQEARATGAEQHAPYPTRLAVELIAQAKEEMGYSAWHRAWELSAEAEALALRARDIAASRGDDDDSAGDADDSAGDDDDSAGIGG